MSDRDLDLAHSLIDFVEGEGEREEISKEQLHAAFVAQLAEGEYLDSISPARFATLATRAVLLSTVSIDWSAEVARSRLFPEGFLSNLAIKLGTGEIDAPRALSELTEREAEITCRIGGLFLSEVLSLARAENPPT